MGRRAGFTLAAVALCGMAIRAAILWWGPREFLSQPWEYEEVARNLFSGRGFSCIYLGTTYRALVHPFYPAFCAAIYKLMGHPSISAVQWTQVALVPLFVLVSYDIGKWISGNRWVGVAASLGVALHPGLLIYSLRPHPLWWDSLCFLTILWLAIRAGRSRPPFSIWVLGLGLAIGWGLLTRATVLVVLPGILAWLLFRWKGQTHRWIRVGGVLLLSGVVALPWSIRNWVVFGRPTPTLTSAAYSFWMGNHPGATGSALDNDGRPLIAKAPPQLLREVLESDELEQQSLFYREARGYIKAYPKQALRRTLSKWWQFWSGSSRTGAWYPSAWRDGYRAYYLLLCLGALVGGWILWVRNRRSELLLLIFFGLSISAAQSLFFVEGRHRWEIESFLILMASAIFLVGARDRPVIK